MGLFHRNNNVKRKKVNEEDIVHQLYNDYISVAYNTALLSETRARTRINPDEYIRNDKKILDIFSNAQSMDAELGLNVGTRFTADYAEATKKAIEDAEKQLGPQCDADPAFVYRQAKNNEQMFHVLADCYLLCSLFAAAIDEMDDPDEKAGYIEASDDLLVFAEYIEIQLALHQSEQEYIADHVMAYISNDCKDVENIANYICEDFNIFYDFMDDFLEGKQEMKNINQLELQESIYDIDRIFADSLNYHEKEAH